MFRPTLLLYVQNSRKDILKIGRACSSVQLAIFYHVTQFYVTKDGITSEVVRAKIRIPYVGNVNQGFKLLHRSFRWESEMIHEKGETKKSGKLREFVDIVV